MDGDVKVKIESEEPMYSEFLEDLFSFTVFSKLVRCPDFKTIYKRLDGNLRKLVTFKNQNVLGRSLPFSLNICRDKGFLQFTFSSMAWPHLK